jgi:hypothetical protein
MTEPMHTHPVHFYYDPPDDPTFKQFDYCWLHLPSGISGERRIWMRNRKDFLEALIYWNKDKNWKYWEGIL